MKKIPSNTDTTPGHSRDTSGSPRARRLAGALNMSAEKDILRNRVEVYLEAIRIYCFLLGVRNS